jgi:hypothetical protein
MRLSIEFRDFEWRRTLQLQSSLQTYLPYIIKQKINTDMRAGLIVF